LREELIIDRSAMLRTSLAPNFGEAFEGEPSGCAYPCAKHNFVAKHGRRLVVDLVAQHNPANGILCFTPGDCSPMCGGNILDPPQVNGVVNVILLVDVGRNDRDDYFKRRGRHDKPMRQQIGQA